MTFFPKIWKCLTNDPKGHTNVNTSSRINFLQLFQLDTFNAFWQHCSNSSGRCPKTLFGSPTETFFFRFLFQQKPNKSFQNTFGGLVDCYHCNTVKKVLAQNSRRYWSMSERTQKIVKLFKPSSAKMFFRTDEMRFAKFAWNSFAQSPECCHYNSEKIKIVKVSEVFSWRLQLWFFLTQWKKFRLWAEKSHARLLKPHSICPRDHFGRKNT